MDGEDNHKNEGADFYRGNPVDPYDLQYRTKFIELLWESLKKRHVLLTAPRRTGKTSVMDHLVAFPQYDYLVIKENIQELSHPADVFMAILGRFHDEHPNLFRDVVAKGWSMVSSAWDKVKELSISEFKVALRDSDKDWKNNWKQHGEKLLSQLRAHDTKVLIIIDELPDMLLNLKKEDDNLLREFLAWFRTQRNEPNPKQDSVRWLVGGSVNLSSTLDEAELVDLINDLDDLPLPILSDDQVKDFVKKMLEARGVALEEEVPIRCLELLGRPIPLFMQMLTQDLHRLWRTRSDSRTLTANDVDTVFNQLVRSSAAQDKLQHYYSRLKQYYSEPKLSAAHHILSQLSLSPKAISRTALLSEFQQIYNQAGFDTPQFEIKRLFNQLMKGLENDFYIEEIEEDRFDFSSGVLKTWWKKYYG